MEEIEGSDGEVEYGVGVNNRYAFLNDNADDDVAVLQQKKEEKAKALSQAPAKKVVKQEGQQKKTEANGMNKGGVAEAAFAETGTDDSWGVSRGGKGGRGNGGGGGHEEGEKENCHGRGGFRGTRSFRNSKFGGGGGRGGGRDRNNEDREIKDDWDGPAVAATNTGNYDDWGGEDSSSNNARGHGQAKDWSGGNTGNERGYRRGGGGGGFRGGRGGRNAGFTRRRDFDRVSGSETSGVKSVDKREGRGAHNWGAYDDWGSDNNVDSSGTTETPKPADQGATDDWGGPTDDWGGPSDDWGGSNDAGHGTNSEQNNGEEAETRETAAAAKAPEPFEEPKTLTLGQWKALQQPKETPTFNIRQPNDGEDPSKWKGLTLKKKESSEQEEDVGYVEEEIWVPQRAGRQKQIKDIGFRFPQREERMFRRGSRQQNVQQQQQPRDRERDNRDYRLFEKAEGQGDYNSSDFPEGMGAGRRGDGYPSRGRGGLGRGGGWRRDNRDRNDAKGTPQVDDIQEFPSLIC